MMNMLKVTIWTLAVLGMVPTILLAVLNIGSNMAMARHLRKNPDFQVGDGLLASSQSYIEFNNRWRLEVATTNWPSILLLFGAAAFVIGLWFLLPRQTQHQNVGGFEKIEPYVERVMQSESPHAYLVISLAEDEYTAVGVSSSAEGCTMDFSLTKKEQIAPVVAFFSERAKEPIEDRVTEEGTEFETRHLSYPIDRAIEEVADLCKSIFTDAYGVTGDQKLIFVLGH